MRCTQQKPKVWPLCNLWFAARLFRVPLLTAHLRCQAKRNRALARPRGVKILALFIVIPWPAAEASEACFEQTLNMSCCSFQRLLLAENLGFDVDVHLVPATAWRNTAEASQLGSQSQIKTQDRWNFGKLELGTLSPSLTMKYGT